MTDELTLHDQSLTYLLRGKTCAGSDKSAKGQSLTLNDTGVECRYLWLAQAYYITSTTSRHCQHMLNQKSAKTSAK